MNATISIRTKKNLKNKAIKILDSYGLNLSTAFNLYLNDIVEKRTRPISDIRYINDDIMKSWEKERLTTDKKEYSTVDDLMKDLK